jgi:hypothetical protein
MHDAFGEKVVEALKDNKRFTLNDLPRLPEERRPVALMTKRATSNHVQSMLYSTTDEASFGTKLIE